MTVPGGRLRRACSSQGAAWSAPRRRLRVFVSEFEVIETLTFFVNVGDHWLVLRV